MNFIQEIAIYAPPFLFALTAHEYAHGYVAHQLGDPTASLQGRLSMNPLKHLDPLGVIAFFMIKIGWAKPVPVDARYFKNPQKDLLLVSLAGPGTNFGLALCSALLAKILAPLHGFVPGAIFWPLFQMIGASIWINIMLAVFNLIPIPPLDGSRIITWLLPRHLAVTYAKMEPFGFLILLALFYTGILPKIIYPIMALAQKIIMP